MDAKVAMPTVTATLAQALRYFLNGAYLLMLLHWTGSPYAPLISTQRDVVILAAIAIVLGTLAYCLHRAVVYPWISRSLWWALAFEATSREPGWWCPYWPLRVEARTAIGRQGVDKLVPYFSGWSGETHFLYIAIWVTALTLWSGGLLHCWITAILVVVLVGAWFWDLALLRAEIEASPITSDRAPAQGR